MRFDFALRFEHIQCVYKQGSISKDHVPIPRHCVFWPG